jgi:hypothetical protein
MAQDSKKLLLKANKYPSKINLSEVFRVLITLKDGQC